MWSENNRAFCNDSVKLYEKTFLIQVVLCLTCGLDIMELVNLRKIIESGDKFLGRYNFNYFLANPR